MTTHDHAAIKDLIERMSNQKVEGNDGPGFRHVRCPKMLWEELVRLVEGLKVEGGRAPLPWRIGRSVSINVYEGDIPVCQCQTSEYAKRIVRAMNAAQQLKREQEPAPRRVGGTIGLDGDTRRDWETDGPALERRVKEFEAAQPPQELVSLRELVVKWRKDAAEFGFTIHGTLAEARTQAFEECADELEAALTRGAVGRAAREPK